MSSTAIKPSSRPAIPQQRRKQLGTSDLTITYWLSQNPTLLATIKVLAIVTGHVLGVIAAHDKAIEVLPRRHQVTGQLPLLLAMVLYTLGGLYLLFGI